MPKATNLYTVKTTSKPGVFEVGKLSQELEVLATYTMEEAGASLFCNCPAYRPWCRHMDIFRKFQAEDKIGKGWFYDFDKKHWLAPISDPT